MGNFWSSKAEESQPIVGGNRWSRVPGQFAQRIDVSDLRTVLEKIWTLKRERADCSFSLESMSVNSLREATPCKRLATD